MKVRFGPFVFDSATRELLRELRPVHLSPKSFDLLQILIERRPALVTKSELQDQLWPDAVVLGDNPKSPAFVSTVSRRGYRFCADVEELGQRVDGALEHRAVRWWLTWRDLILPLSEGKNVVGRHPSSGVWINATSVSRVHAHVVIAPGHTTVEDCGSTNGTFVNGKRITSPHP